MSNKIITLVASTSKLPEETPGALRELADKIERGEIQALAIAYEEKGEYCMTLCSSLEKTLVLSTLMKHWPAEKILKGGG